MNKPQVACIYCESKNYIPKYDFKDIYGDQFSIVECQDCHVSYLKPKPTVEQLKRAYDESYYGYGEKKFNPTVEKVIDWFRKRKAGKFSKYLPEKAKVLDIGCGNGNFLHSLGKCGDYELHGIEPEGKSAERAKNYKEINLVEGTLEHTSFEKNYFNAISLIHVFEHLDRPKETLDIINEISHENAILWLELPNIDSWQARMFKANWLHLDPPRHLILLSPKRLKTLMKDMGWGLVREEYFSPQFSPFGVQQSLLNLISSKRDVLYEYLKGNKAYVQDYSYLTLKAMQLFHWLSFPIFVFTDIISSLFKKGGTVSLIFRKLD